MAMVSALQPGSVHCRRQDTASDPMVTPAGASWWLLPKITVGTAITALLCMYLEYGVDLSTTTHAKRFRPTQQMTPTNSTAGPTKGLTIFSAGNWERIWFHFLTLTVASLLGIAYYRMPKAVHPPAAWLRFKKKARKIITTQLFPAKFWFWWCGGVNMAELLGVLIWLFINAWYFQYLYKRYRADVTALVNSGLHTGLSYNMLMLERVGLAFGIMMRPCLWMLFLPVPHISFLTRLTGLSWAKLIKYHRWMGHGTMVIFTFHAIPHWIYWAALDDVSFWGNFLDWSHRDSQSYLAGNLAYAFGLLLWITGMDWCRRRYFEVFYRSHIIGFLGFTVFAYMHYVGSWFMFMPPLMLYAIDLVFRAGQLAHTTPLHICRLTQEDTIITVQMSTDKDFACTPSQDLFLQVPAIDRFAWHPFTCAKFERQPGTDKGLLTLHVKKYNGWTKEFWARTVVKGEQLRGKVSGPFGPPIEHMLQRSWEQYSTAILIAGGNGAVPLLALLDDLVPRMASGQAGHLQKVVLVWLSQSGDEFHIMDPELLSLARDNSWLEVSLHITRHPILTLSNHTGSSSSSESPTIEQEKLLANTEQAEMDRMYDQNDGLRLDAPKVPESPYGWKAMALQPELRGGMIEVLVTCLVFIGALAGSIVPVAFNLEYQATTTAKRLPNNLYSLYGLLLFLCQAIGALGLPYVLVVWPTHAFRAWTCKSPVNLSFSSGKLPALNLDPMMPQLHLSRPNLKMVLHDVVGRNDCPGDHGYGLYVGGPSVMYAQAQKLVHGLNKSGHNAVVYAETSWL